MKNTIYFLLILMLSMTFLYMGCTPKALSNDYIQIVDSMLKSDDKDIKFVEVKVIFKKRALGRTYPDKPIDLISQQLRYGELPDRNKIHYFDSDYQFKVFVDLYGSDNKLIRTDSAYYDEYMPFHVSQEIAEILPGEQKTIIFGVPKSVASVKAWVTKK